MKGAVVMEGADLSTTATGTLEEFSEEDDASAVIGNARRAALSSLLMLAV